MIIAYVVGFIGFVAMVLTTTLSVAVVPGYAQARLREMQNED